MFCCLTWYIWYARNHAIFQNEQLDIVLCHQRAQKIFLDYSEANTKENVQPDSLSIDNQQPDIESFSRITSDAAVHPERECGLGTSIWNSQGQFQAAKVQCLQMPLDPEVAEALACRMGIQLALSLNISHARIESDCKSLIKRLHSTTPECTELGKIVVDIHFLYSNCYFFIVVKY